MKQCIVRNCLYFCIAAQIQCFCVTVFNFIFNLSFVSSLNEAHVKYYWFLQKMLISCRSETNGNFISLLSRRGSLSFSLFSGATPPLLCIPHRSVGCPATERSGRCISTQVSNASHAPRQVFLAGCKQQKTAFCSF